MEAEQIYQACDEAIELMSPHLLTLAVKRQQTVYEDDYGNERLDRWYREVDYFIDNVLMKGPLINEWINEADILGREFPNKTPEILRLTAVVKREARDGVRGLVDHRVKLAISEGILKPVVSDNIDDIDGVGFEHHCASVLRDHGWNAAVTQSSGDQGVDVIASCDGVKVVLQCKRYSQPVGNSAVQEVIAGRVFEKADFAVVVSNSTYTQSARRLASAADVLLIHYSSLGKLFELLSIGRTSDD